MMTTITTAQAAAIVGCHPTTIKKWCRRKRIKAQMVERIWQIDKAALLEFARKYDTGHGPADYELNKRFAITPTSHKRRRATGGIKLYLAMREIVERRPELGGVVR